jgi:hypothetical protein
VDLMIFFPPFGFAADGGDAFHAGVPRGWCGRFDADDIIGIEGIHGFGVFSLVAEFDEFFADFHGGVDTAHD